MDPADDPKIADKLARMNLAGKISQTKPGCRTLLGKPRPKRSAAKPGEKFEVNAVQGKNAVAGKTSLARPSGPEPGEPSTPVEAKRPSAGALKGAEIVSQAQSAIEEAEQRRAEAVESLSEGNLTERDLNMCRAVVAEEDAALAFHRAALTYGQAMIDAHSGTVLSTEGTRGLTRLQAEMGLKRKKYESVRLQAQASRGFE